MHFSLLDQSLVSHSHSSFFSFSPRTSHVPLALPLALKKIHHVCFSFYFLFYFSLRFREIAFSGKIFIEANNFSLRVSFFKVNWIFAFPSNAIWMKKKCHSNNPKINEIRKWFFFLFFGFWFICVPVYTKAVCGIWSQLHLVEAPNQWTHDYETMLPGIRVNSPVSLHMRENRVHRNPWRATRVYTIVYTHTSLVYVYTCAYVTQQCSNMLICFGVLNRENNTWHVY